MLDLCSIAYCFVLFGFLFCFVSERELVSVLETRLNESISTLQLYQEDENDFSAFCQVAFFEENNFKSTIADDPLTFQSMIYRVGK